MSFKRPLKIDTLLLSDSDDDDDLLNDDATSFLRKKPPAVVTPTNEECLTPLGTCTFPLIVADDRFIGEELNLTLEERGKVRIIAIRNSQGLELSSFLPQHTVGKLAPILRKQDRMVCQTTRTSQQFLQINFFGKADRILGEFECAPLVRELQKHLGDAFTRIRKATRKAETAATVAPSTAPNSMPLVASASVTTVASTAAAAVPIITPTNIQVNQQGQAYSVEEEELVKSIIANGSKSYYDILNVSEQATIADLKLSYRKVAIKVHPDKNRSPNANLAFQLVGQAYSVLSDPDQRAEYDTARQDRKPAPPTAAPPTPFEFDAEELYRSFFPEDDVDTVHVEMSEPDWEFQKDSLEEMFDTILAKQLDNLPDYDMPPQLAHMKLFDYQILGIRFMLHSELRNGIPSWFTQEGPWTWRDKITGTTFQRRPNPVRGCILADDMGLGKSVQTLGLILSNPPKGQTGYPYVPARSLGANTGPRCTLILCPLSVIANWTTQIRKHVNQMGRKSFLKVGIYHGPNRKDMVRSIQANYYDIVLTSYQTLAYDYRRKYGTDEKDKEGNKKTKKDKKEIFLFDLWLHRVVLDEAHIIRNSKTSLFKAVKHLNSTFRLCLTGTVFVNRPDDIHSLLSFLGALPLAQKSVFKRYVTDKIKERKEVGMSVLRAAMAYVTLRRRKDMVASTVKLVKRTVKVEAIPFEEGHHKSLHDVLYTSARALLGKFFSFGDDFVMENYMHFIALILRVRQSSCHASLIPPECKQRAEEILDYLVQKKGKEDMDVTEAEELLERLPGVFEGMEKLEECAICMEALGEESAVILRDCKHIFCSPCLNQVANSCCPLCRTSFSPDDIISKGAAKKAASKENKKPKPKVKNDQFGQSPKLAKLFELIESMKPDEKGVIFSQWTSLLDIIQRSMQELGHTFTRIDGTMNAQQRIDAMEAFDTERCDSMRTPRFILCSLHACGTGINLERGNVAFLVDPWWNVAAETQAMNRIHRISSKKPVRIYRLVMDKTLEQRMLALQDAKELLGKGAMERLSPAEKRKARLTQLRDLFELPENMEQDWEEY